MLMRVSIGIHGDDIDAAIEVSMNVGAHYTHVRSDVQFAI
jgi:hypothetical protein